MTITEIIQHHLLSLKAWNTPVRFVRSGTSGHDCRFRTNIVIDALNGIAAADAEYARYTL